ncbi:hypothetical protein KS4_28420 [Poriferisphaera corsica]|uniref:Uncharacterized protein n=1 Tax=Poriferisphaera corsica TaxID=2528020 RepID=A0A517YX36_9BACT|nr:hypothetical protein [Poriferisphaera corsica]QDU34767.1 hypothetical protein KS4_28420 [Poriferisphaera corsica]
MKTKLSLVLALGALTLGGTNLFAETVAPSKTAPRVEKKEVKDADGAKNQEGATDKEKAPADKKEQKDSKKQTPKK